VADAERLAAGAGDARDLGGRSGLLEGAVGGRALGALVLDENGEDLLRSSFGIGLDDEFEDAAALGAIEPLLVLGGGARDRQPLAAEALDADRGRRRGLRRGLPRRFGSLKSLARTTGSGRTILAGCCSLPGAES